MRGREIQVIANGERYMDMISNLKWQQSWVEFRVIRILEQWMLLASSFKALESPENLQRQPIAWEKLMKTSIFLKHASSLPKFPFLQLSHRFSSLILKCFIKMSLKEWVLEFSVNIFSLSSWSFQFMLGYKCGGEGSNKSRCHSLIMIGLSKIA